MNTENRTERRSALDEFAQASAASANIPAAISASPPLGQIYGAQQVAVYRDERRVLNRLRELAAAMGDEWYYRFPVRNKKENRIDYIEGASVKLANDLARIYGNCEVDVRVQDFGDGWLFYARFLDLESGYSLTRPFQQRRSAGKIGGDDDARRLDIAFQIGASKAIRNVITNALQTFSDFAFEEARNALVERIGKDLAGYRNRTTEKVSAHVAIERVEAVIGRPAKGWLAPDVARVIAMMKGVTDGMASLDETFPPSHSNKEQDTGAALDAFVSEQESSPQSTGDDGGDPEASILPASSSIPADAGPQASAELRGEMMDKALRLAADKTISIDERLSALDRSMHDWLQQLPGDEDFVRCCFSTARDQAEGKTKAIDARRYLLGIMEKA